MTLATLRQKIAVARSNEFLRNILTLVTGAGISQAIPIAVMPILTRLYSPEEFGVFALFVSVVAIFSVAATARYDLAVMLPRKEASAASVVVLSSAITLVLSACLAAGVFFFDDQIVRLLSNEEIRPWLYLIPATTALVGLNQSLSIWVARKKQFDQLAYCRVTESGTTAGTQFLLYGLTHSGGLILGNVLGKLAATLVLARGVLRDDKPTFRSVTKENILASAVEYQNFPKFSVGGALLDTTASQLPVLLIGRFFSASTTGFFSLSFRVLCLPITLISSSLSQVLFQKVREIQQERPEHLRAYILSMFFLLLVLVSPLVIITWFFGEWIFVLVFGEKWRLAGALAGYLSIAVAIRFAVSPLSSVMSLNENVKTGAVWQAGYFLTMLSTLLFFRNYPIMDFILAFSIHEVVLYLIYLYLILKGAEDRRTERKMGVS